MNEMMKLKYRRLGTDMRSDFMTIRDNFFLFFPVIAVFCEARNTDKNRT